MAHAMTFQQLAACLVHAVKELTLFVNNEGPPLTDKQIEEKLEVVHNIVSLGFSIPLNMALAVVNMLVQLVTDKLALEKDFILMNALKLLTEFYRQISKDPKVDQGDLYKLAGFQEPLVCQFKWTLFLVKEAPQVSPNFVLEAVKALNEQISCLHIQSLQQSKIGE
jgi:hypothetical protein